MDTEPPNAIEQRISRLNSLWMQFRELPEAHICRWLLKDDEVQILRGFIDLVQRPDSEIPDLFFPLETAFTKSEKYSEDLINELHERLLNEKEKSEINIDWHPSLFLPG